jgi:hypothetical protein
MALLLHQINQQPVSAFLFVDGVDDDVRVEEIGGHGLAGGFSFESALAFLAQFPHPLHRSLFQLRMVFILPGTGGGFQRFDLPKAHEFLFGGLGDEAAALTSAYQRVNVLDQLIGEHDVCSSVHGRFKGFWFIKWADFSPLVD